MITAPVSRHLVVAEIEQSKAFYRDVLGFEVKPVLAEHGRPAALEVVSGPARLQLGTGGPPEAASLFFETDDVAAMHAVVTARGGKPSSMERVNWIKMRMFELRDPDGHVVWFGQSFQEPDLTREPLRQLRQALPEFPVPDVPAAIAHYQRVLGFSINYAQDDLGVMYRDDVTLCLIPRTERQPGIGSCYVYIRDADALHAELVAKGADVRGEPVSQPWGLRDFQVLDLAGNRLTFGQTFE